MCLRSVLSQPPLFCYRAKIFECFGPFCQEYYFPPYAPRLLDFPSPPPDIHAPAPPFYLFSLTLCERPESLLHKKPLPLFLTITTPVRSSLPPKHPIFGNQPPPTTPCQRPHSIHFPVHFFFPPAGPPAKSLTQLAFYRSAIRSFLSSAFIPSSPPFFFFSPQFQLRPPRFPKNTGPANLFHPRSFSSVFFPNPSGGVSPRANSSPLSSYKSPAIAPML